MIELNNNKEEKEINSWNDLEHYFAEVMSERDLYKEQCSKLQQENAELRAMLETEEYKHSGLLEEE